MKTETIPAKYHFSDDEKLELGQKLALTNQKLAQLEDEKKQVTSGYKAKIDSEQADPDRDVVVFATTTIKNVHGHDERIGIELPIEDVRHELRTATIFAGGEA